MFNYLIKAGTADVSVVLRIIDSADGTPETGVVWNTSGIDLEYRREGAAVVAITEATLAALTTAHTDGGFLHIGNGYYRLDLPDAACATGVTGVLVEGTVTGMVVIGCYIQLVTFDPFDSVRLGLTALPNAVADAAGGLPISDAGGLDMDSIKTDTAAILVDTADMQPKIGTITNTGGTATIGAVLGDVANSSMATRFGLVQGYTDDIGVAGAGLTAVPWNANWDAEVQSECDDALVARDLDHLTNNGTSVPAVTAGTYLDQIMDDGTAVYNRATDSLQAHQDGAVTPPSAATIADAVWDEATADHVTADTFGDEVQKPKATLKM